VATPVAEPTRALTVRFDLVAPSASRVAIVGDFNQWNAESLPMRRSADGSRWEIEVRLPPGRYTYGFVVDGKLMRDPRAPESASDDFGIPNSVRMVSRAGGSS
jgi:1,4-alpha-glucan branching enzyme